MKLVRYSTRDQEKPGLIDSNGKVRDLSQHINDLSKENLSPESLEKIRNIDIDTLPIIEGNPQQDLRLGACVGQTSKFICIGLNYADHAAETGAQIPSEPVIFSKFTSAIIGPDDDVQIPKNSSKTDWEVELGVVIGTEAQYVTEQNALDYVAGYCLINDLSEREFQLEREGTWDKGKGCDTFGPTGPWLVTPDEIEDINNLNMWCEVNGHRFQDGNTSTMVYKVPFLIAYCSQFMTLKPGDIISTGTPPGVGMGQNPPQYLKGGEVMTLGIDRLGTQTQKVLGAIK